MKIRTVIIFFIIWILLLTIPFGLGFILSNKQHLFLGFLLNPIDGVTYLAKMQEGASGYWTYHLPYSAISHNRVFLFVFYLLIGKISNFFSIDFRFGFHIFRLLGAFIFFYLCWKYVDKIQIQNWLKPFLFFILLFGGGLGWLYVISGNLPVDFWVAEAFPFLSAISNPHFILTFAILIYYLFFLEIDKKQPIDYVLLALVSLVLANISPFAIVISGVIFGVNSIWNYIHKKQINILTLSVFGLSTLPIIFYQTTVVLNNPLLSSWNQQNITPSPGFFNFLFSLSPFLILNFFMLIWVWIKKISLSKRVCILLAWIIFSSIMLFFPINLQRRFLVSLYLPVVVLTFDLISIYFENSNIKYSIKKSLIILVLVFSLPSNLIVLTGAITAENSFNENLFVNTSDFTTIQWLGQNSRVDEIVLAEEKISLYIPAFTNLRVVVGHPYETPNYGLISHEIISFYDKPTITKLDFLIEKFSPNYFIVQKNQKFQFFENYDYLIIIYENDKYIIYWISK